ncbi:hypothetical protein FRC07_001937, partial [Ceratobasidium sp. 392]
IDSSDRGKESAVTSDLDISRQRIDVCVRNLGFMWTKTSFLTRSRTEKYILRDVSAVFPSGQVTAILGPSGAGKSTLLQLLASRRLNPGFGAKFSVQGEVLFNGRPIDRNSRSQVAFVEQEDDYHLPALTVRETLRYAAILRLPRKMSRKHKIARAEEVMKMLGLDICADNLVGGELLKGISGGEKRRLSLAVQMINDPSVLIVDEPTSGLDALTANNVMTALNDIARSGRTVILSIHQPRSDIYVDKLDNIVLLVKGGQVVYAGPRNEVEGTFALAGYPIPPLYNPADWLLDVASVDLRGTREPETKARVAKLVDFWANLQRKTDAIDIEKPENNEDMIEIGADNKFTPMWIALPLIVERMTRNLWRQQAVFWVRLQQLPFLGVLFLLFYQRLKNGPSGGQDRIGYFQEMVSPVSFVGLLNCIAIFPKDRDLYFHEYRSSAAYSEATFIIGFTLVALPLEIMAALLFTVVTNIGAGMQTNARIFFEYAVAIFALQSNGESFGIAFACVTNSLGLSVSTIISGRIILRQYPKSITIRTPGGDIKEIDAPVASAIRAALHLTPNLVDLNLSLTSTPFNAIFKDSDFPFTLRKFSGPLHSSHGFAQFLNKQSLLEELYVSHTPRGFSLQRVDPHALSKLSVVSSNFQTLLSLVPSRPLSRVDCTTLSPNEFVEFGDLLTRSAGSVCYLDVVLLRSRKEIVKTVQLFIDSIPAAYDTLEHLHVTLSFPLDFISKHNSIHARLKRYTSSQEFEELRLALGKFARLQTFSLSHERCNNDLPPEFCHSVTELNQLNVWRSSSPSLISMSLFGVAPA